MLVVVIGVNGQDGSFIAEAELLKGNTVVGLGKKPTSLYLKTTSNFIYEQCDITDPVVVKKVFSKYCPTLIYHFAAIHGSYDFNYSDHSQQLFTTNTSSVLYILEWIVNSGLKNIKFVYASSSKIFNRYGLINESTEQTSVDLYSLSKIYAGQIINHYRSKFGLDASIIWFFNHESTRRNQNFFTAKLVLLISSYLNGQKILKDSRGLNFYEDWGSAMEYMSILSKLVEIDEFKSQDIILATGVTTNAFDLVLKVCNHFNIDIYEVFSIDKSNYNTNISNLPPFIVDISKLKQLSSGVIPTLTPFEIIVDMINQVDHG